MTNGLDNLLLVICASIIGYEFFVGGLPKVVLLIAFMGLLINVIAFVNKLRRR